MALYRKYRPATFAEVVGQEHVTDPLSTALDTGRISHAYLFSGPRGCGKTSSARILARSLNCVQGPTSTPCGVCPSCVALGPGGPGNLDVIELDAASHGGVDDTRELRDRAFYAPAESRYRVFIVDEAHMVTTAGFNALLKIVEEPPAHLIFIFATTEPDKVLPTIRSRTHHYPFRLLPPATMRGLLGRICEQEQVPVEEAVYPLVIRAGGGSPRDSLSVLDQLLAGAGSEGVTYARAVALLGVTDVALIDDAVEALAADDGAALFGTVDRVMEAGHDPRRFAVDLLDRFRDLILLRAVPDATERGLVTGPGDVLDRMRDQAERLGPATLTRYAELLHEGLGEMRGATAPRLLLEVVCARMLLPSVSDGESATLQRLERLERGLAAGSFGAATDASSAAPGAPSQPGPAGVSPSEPPRRRGAEALAAIRRENRGGAATGPARASGSTGATETGVPSAVDAAQTRGAASAGDVVPDGGTAAEAAVADHAATVGDNAARDRSASSESGSVTAVPSGDVRAAEAASAGRQAPTGAAESGRGGASPSSAESAGRSNSAAQADAAHAPQAGVGDPAGTVASAGRFESGGPAHGAAGQSPSGSSVSEQAAPHRDSSDEVAGSRAPAAAGDSASARTAEAAGARSDVAEGGHGAGRDDVRGSRAADAQPAGVPPQATAQPASAAAGSDLLGEVEAAWGEIRSKVREFGAAVQAMLAGASVARVEGDVIVFAHQHAPLAQRLSDPRNLEAVRSAVRAVLGRDHDVRWEVGGAPPRPAAPRSGGSANRPRTPGNQTAARESGDAPGRAPDAPAPPRFSRPSQSRNAGADRSADAGRSRSAGANPRPQFADDDIPPPDYPDLPDDPGPADYPSHDSEPPGNSAVTSRGRDHDGVVPASTPEEEQEMMAAAADPVAPGDRRDPDEVALELLKSELGATRLDG
ncbi:DNA polymerase III subunit gamma and tau [Nocardia amamiensis]|uniref:DNA-directed DNA polymerase n=1 Tax=Nocardia amamiensis TaxID=404578 RepID=A0ABS0CTU2_9NOCA|nr:DNA polymerase III subunit gamma and tau [Nocardia amamiensis]MBF6298183.1 DNA polymerase III subunit gamma and tau [Nocardia amamiensis]